MEKNQTKTGIVIILIMLLMLMLFFFKKEGSDSHVHFENVINNRASEVYVLPLKNRDMIYVKFVFKNAGVLNNDLNAHGISNLVSALLFKKINGLSKEETFDKIIEMGVRDFEVNSYEDDFKISFFVKKDNAEQVFHFFNNTFVNPSFSDGDVETAKESIPAVVNPETTYPTQLMRQKLFELLYGSCSYGMNPSGTSQTISEISKKDIENFIKQKLTCKNLKAFFVGDISKYDIRNYLNIIFENVPDGKSNSALTIPEYNYNDNISSAKIASPEIIRKENMRDVIGIAHGIRIDQLSDVGKAAVRIIIKALFDDNYSDFSKGLIKLNIAHKIHAEFIERSYSNTVFLFIYIDKKNLNTYMKYFNEKIAEYQKNINFDELKDIQEYMIKVAENGFYNISDIDEKIEKIYLPFAEVSTDLYKNTIKKLFVECPIRTVICTDK
ncbi:MAG: insulinase family protein [Alphaproteobacteria bacterium]|nr:insulinase family protein [Alphaproteobacteria bacterium]